MSFSIHRNQLPKTWVYRAPAMGIGDLDELDEFFLDESPAELEGTGTMPNISATEMQRREDIKKHMGYATKMANEGVLDPEGARKTEAALEQALGTPGMTISQAWELAKTSGGFDLSGKTTINPITKRPWTEVPVIGGIIDAGTKLLTGQGGDGGAGLGGLLGPIGSIFGGGGSSGGILPGLPGPIGGLIQGVTQSLGLGSGKDPLSSILGAGLGGVLPFGTGMLPGAIGQAAQGIFGQSGIPPVNQMQGINRQSILDIAGMSEETGRKILEKATGITSGDLADIKKMLKDRALQIDATAEHRDIVAKDAFKDEVRNMMKIIMARLNLRPVAGTKGGVAFSLKRW